MSRNRSLNAAIAAPESSLDEPFSRTTEQALTLEEWQKSNDAAQIEALLPFSTGLLIAFPTLAAYLLFSEGALLYFIRQFIEEYFTQQDISKAISMQSEMKENYRIAWDFYNSIESAAKATNIVVDLNNENWISEFTSLVETFSQRTIDRTKDLLFTTLYRFLVLIDIHLIPAKLLPYFTIKNVGNKIQIGTTAKGYRYTELDVSIKNKEIKFLGECIKEVSKL